MEPTEACTVLLRLCDASLEALKISGLWSGRMSIIHLQQHNAGVNYICI